MNKGRLRTLGHVMAAIVILLHGWDAYEKGHSTATIFFVTGIFFLSIAFFHHKLVRRYPRLDGFFFMLEAIAISTTAYDYFHEGKLYLPWVMVGVTILYGILGFLVLSGKKSIGQHA